MKSKVVLACVIAISTLVWLAFSLSSAPAGDFVPTLVSDKTQTVDAGSISNIDSIATGDYVHLIWSEATTTTNPYDYDLFYRRLPDGSTINLSKTAPTNGKVSPAVIKQTSGNNVCVLWREVGQDDYHHLYLWRSATNTTSVVPGNASDNSNFTLPNFYCDDYGNARLGQIDVDSNQVVYWDESIGTQVQVSSADGYSAGRFSQQNVEGVTYLIWSKYISGRSYFYIWDSLQKSEQEITSSQYVSSLETYADQNNTIHLIWSVFPDIHPGYYVYWDTVSQTVGEFDPQDIDLVSTLDGANNLHAAWSGGYWSHDTIHYWNVTQNMTASINTEIGSSNEPILIGGPDDTAHLVWQISSSGDLHYLNSESLVDHFVTQASSYILQSNNTAWDFDSTGEIHIVWADSLVSHSDKDVVYWTPSLTEPITLTQSTLYYPSVDIHIDHNDNIHVVSHTQNNTLHYWNDQMDDMQTIADSANEYLVTSDANGEGLVFYTTFLDELYYWDSSTQNTEQLWFAEEMYDIHDETGWLYLHWVGPEQQYSSDSDMYAVWTEHELSSYEVYLPAIIK